MVTMAEKALGVLLGIETLVGKGPTGKAGRAALRIASKTILASGRGTYAVTRVAAPVAVRGGLAAAAIPGVVPATGGLAAYEAHRRGYLDPAYEALRYSGQQAYEALPHEPGPQLSEALGLTGEGPIGSIPKRAKSKFNMAVSRGMKAVKKSTSYGKKGTISNAKKAFSAVTKTASKISKGKKVSSKGIIGKIKRAIGPMSLRRKKPSGTYKPRPKPTRKY